MTTNPYAEAVKNAGNACIAARCDDHDPRPTDYAEVAVAAAVGPLLAPVRALHKPAAVRRRGGDQLLSLLNDAGERFCGHCYHIWPCPTAQALDAIEAGATVRIIDRALSDADQISDATPSDTTTKED